MASKKHVLLRFGGSYGQTYEAPEIWECGLRFAAIFGTVDPIAALPENLSAVDDVINRTETDWTILGNFYVKQVGGAGNAFHLDDWLNDQVAPALTTWMAAMQLSSSTRLDWAEAALLESPTGKYVAAPPLLVGTPVRLDWTSGNPTGGSSGNQMPSQVSLCVSHEGYQNGPRGRGRMFLPAAGTGAVSGGRLNAAYTSDMLDAHVAMLNDCVVTTGVGVVPIITGAPYTDYSVIQRVKIGDLFDKQSRRRNRLTETYTSLSTGL